MVDVGFLLHSLLVVVGWTISPMKVEVTPERPQAFFTIASQSQDRETVAIEIHAANREIDLHGEESRTPNEEEFFIYPSQFLLKPGGRRTIRVIWRGDSSIQEEQAYRIVADQLPVSIPIDVEDEEGNLLQDVGMSISIGTRYVTSFYVTPRHTRPDLQLTQWSWEEGEEENPSHLLLELHNGGSRHLYLPRFGLVCDRKGEGREELFSAPEMEPHLEGGINLLPGHRRLVRIPWDGAFTLVEGDQLQIIQ